MEARKITIVSTKTQKKSVIMSSAETLAELKADLTNAGIDYNDMTFYEGVSKTELLNDNSVLPKDVPYTNRRTGETVNTNELVFMLTNRNKKIASGMASRAELYEEIRNLGLQFEVQRTYGKNYTNCTSTELAAVIADAKEFLSSEETEEVEEEKGCPLFAAFNHLVNALYEDSYIDDYTYKKIASYFEGENAHYSSYSDAEINEMFEDIDS